MRRRAQPWLGTLVDITIAAAASDQEADMACNSAFKAIAEVHALMSFHSADSDVSRINHAAVGDLVAVHSWTAEVLKAALQFSKDTNGIFNIACAPTLVTWHYLPQIERVAPSSVSTDPVFTFETATSIRKTAPGWIDLGGIAKGYAVDRAVQVLEEQEIASGCVNAGGDLRAFGDIAFPVLLRDPSQPAHMRAQIPVRNRALATSAAYFSKKEIDGHNVCALINGKNGQPVAHNRSTTVLAPTCMVADALTKHIAVTENLQDPLLEQYAATAFII